MELRQLKYFLATAEELHFRRAAELVHVAQPALSQQIHQLEEEIGVTLFERSNRKVALTPAGKTFYERARILVDNASKAIQDTRSIGRGDAGTLTISFLSTAAMSILPSAFRFIWETIPSAEIDLRELGPQEQVDSLHLGQVDLGFVIAEILDEEFSIRCVGKEKLIAALPATPEFSRMEQVDLGTLAKETTIVPVRHSRRGYFETVMAAYRNEGVKPARIQCTRMIQTGLVLVSTGLGISLVPESFVHVQIDGVLYRPLVDPGPTIEISAVWRKDNKSPLLLRFVQEFINKLPE
ncbi:MAG: LysR substrate-binding domain-containing protein [Holophaga sp.]|nr:LysR substrate-binding domain-containing protein [Holophaga sp.]